MKTYDFYVNIFHLFANTVINHHFYQTLTISQAGGILDKSPRSSGLARSPNGGAPSPLFGQHGGSPHQQQNGNGTAITATTATATTTNSLTPVAAVALQQQQQEPEQQTVVPAPDYELEYRRIENKAQRDYYKQVFTKERPRYLELYRAVDLVSERFKHLESQMRQLEQGSLAWKVRARIKCFLYRVTPDDSPMDI